MTLQNKTKIVFLTVALVLMIVLSYWMRQVKVQEHTVKLRKFDSTAIMGRIKYHSISAGYVYLKIHGYKDTKFQFRPITSELNENTIFFHIVEKGDSIYKPKFSDTLELIKNGKKYKYTFENQPL